MTVKTANRNLDSLELNFRAKVDLFLKEVWHLIFVTEAHRTQERQNYLYAQGRIAPYKSNPIVTWTLDSYHKTGRAIDIAFFGSELYPKKWETWDDIAKVAKKHWIDWGYSLWKRDRPHFQDNNIPLIKKPMQKSYEELENENKILRRRAEEVDDMLDTARRKLLPNNY